MFWQYFEWFDFAMELYLAFSIIIYFMHWHELIRFFVDRNFIEPLKKIGGDENFDVKYSAVLSKSPLLKLVKFDDKKPKDAILEARQAKRDLKSVKLDQQTVKEFAIHFEEVIYHKEKRLRFCCCSKFMSVRFE